MTDETNTNPYFGDGETYGRELGRVSPEGNVYGSMRVVRDVIHSVWWSGSAWVLLEVAGQVDFMSGLPAGPRPFGEVWQITQSAHPQGTYCFWGENGWQEIRWLWTVDGWSELPTPGHQVGEAHQVKEPDVLAIWDGYAWQRFPRHSGLFQDEPQRHLPTGFLDMLVPDVRVVWLSSREISLETLEGGAGYLLINGDRVVTDYRCSVFSTCQSLEYSNDTITPMDLEPDTEYWIYLANTLNQAFVTPDWDFRGKLFLSRTTPQNGYLSRTGIGRNARLAGKIQTDTNESSPAFLKELNLSIVSNRASLPEAFRDYSDYVVSFVDQNTLALQRLDGAYGQLYIPEGLHYLGFDFEVSVFDVRILWDDQVENKVVMDESEIAGDTLYYLYLSSDVDAFNFNTTNSDTQRPWQEGDTGAEDNYDPDLDFRLKPFLSVKAPDHGRMSESWPGFYTRLIGQVMTDSNGHFTNARDLSLIRQPTLNPTYFDGLAEVSFVHISADEFRVCRKGGTSGVVLVAGSAVQTYPKTDLMVHKATTGDTVYTYTESQQSSPLSSAGVVTDFNGNSIYLYLANERSHWGAMASRLFFCTTQPIQGYLSRNWPGNQARWIATVLPDATGGQFLGSYIDDAVTPPVPIIDDTSTGPQDVWSGQKINSELSKLWATLNASYVYDLQKTQGLPMQLVWIDTAQFKVLPNAPGTQIVFPDLDVVSFPDGGRTCAVDGVAGSMQYIYISKAGVYCSDTAPNYTYDALQALDNDILVGYLATGASGLEDLDHDLTSIGSWEITDLKGLAAYWKQDYSGSLGHFEGTEVDLDDDDVVDKGSGLVGLPATGHGLSAGQKIRVYSTTHYNGSFTLDATTSENELVIPATYVAETLTSFAKCRRRLTIGSGNNCPDIVRGCKVVLNGGSAYIRVVSGDGQDDGAVTLTEEMTSQAVDYVYGLVEVEGEGLSLGGFYEPNGATNPGTSYATPAMTSNTAPSPAVVSGDGDAQGIRWCAFDQNTGTYTYHFTRTRIYLGDGNGVPVNKWGVSQSVNESSVALGTTLLQACDGADPDDGDWLTLDQRTITNNGWNGYYTFQNDTPYENYRILSSQRGAVYLLEIKLVEAEWVSPASSQVTYLSEGAALDVTDISGLLRLCATGINAAAEPSIRCAVSFDGGDTWSIRRPGVRKQVSATSPLAVTPSYGYPVTDPWKTLDGDWEGSYGTITTRNDYIYYNSSFVIDLGSGNGIALDRVRVLCDNDLGPAALCVWVSDDNSSWTGVLSTYLGSVTDLNFHPVNYMIPGESLAWSEWVEASNQSTTGRYLKVTIGSLPYLGRGYNARTVRCYALEIVDAGGWVDVVKFDSVWKYWDGDSWEASPEDTLRSALQSALSLDVNALYLDQLAMLASPSWESFLDGSNTDLRIALVTPPSTVKWIAPLSGFTGKVERGHNHLGGAWGLCGFWDAGPHDWVMDLSFLGTSKRHCWGQRLPLPGCVVPPGWEIVCERTGTSHFACDIAYYGDKTGSLTGEGQAIFPYATDKSWEIDVTTSVAVEENVCNGAEVIHKAGYHEGGADYGETFWLNSPGITGSLVVTRKRT